jgi:ribosome-associated toxin RatA of RatAB toxin-antitoxin module
MRRWARYTFFNVDQKEGRLQLTRSVLVPYSVESMFDLIEQAEDYPMFLPWCVGARIIERSDDWVAARIEFSYLQVRFGFETRNPKRRPDWLQVRLVEGPFRHFQADWQLTPLGSQGCKVSFALSYEISHGLLDRISVPAVERVSRAMMDAFVKRAEDTLSVGAMAAAPAFAQVIAQVIAPLTDGPPAEPEGVQAITTPQFAAALPELPELPAVPDASDPSHRPDPTPIVTATENSMTPTDPALYAAVQACPLAQDLSPAQTAVLAQLLSLESFATGQVLGHEGSSDNRLYMVVDGALGVVRSAGTPEETLIVTLNPGDFAHELGFLDGSQRYASLVATTPARVLVLERDRLESLIDSHPQILYRVMCAIVRAVHRIQTRQAMQAAELSNYVFKQHGRY